MEPVYLKSYETKTLEKRIVAALSLLKNCAVCPRQCGANRMQSAHGVCRTGRLAMVSSYNPHFGEEAPLVGRLGSGTIFFTNCNLGCVFCQNYEISHISDGVELEPSQLAALMMDLQRRGCHNINFVTPSHVAPQILEALPFANQQPLTVPLIYNSSGYDSVETLRLLDGIFDIYMPDMKFDDSAVAATYCNAPDYPQISREAVKEMYRQVGDLAIDANGVAYRGLLVRHLVMPENKAGTKAVMSFLAREVSPNTYVNIMPQYRPCGQARQFPELSRPIRNSEFFVAMQDARDCGLTRLDG